MLKVDAECKKYLNRYHIVLLILKLQIIKKYFFVYKTEIVQITKDFVLLYAIL